MELRASYTDIFEHAFDVKGRITVPSEWRGESYESRLFIFPSTEKCVKIYPESWLGRVQSQMAQFKTGDPQRKQLEALASLAQGASFDQQGRIMVKEKLRLGAGLKKEAVLVGRLDHFQIWDKTEWDEKNTAATTVEEALSAIGL